MPFLADIRDQLPAGLDPDSPVLLFDGECVLCTRWVPFVIRRDPEARIRLASCQSGAGREILAACGLPVDHFETMIFVERGRAYSRSAAFFRLVRHLSKPWPFLAAGVAVPRFLRDWIYDLIARNRYRLFGRLETCRVPDEEERARFLS